MGILGQAVAICQNAEKAMRELMQGAIAGGEYRELPALARVAEQMSQMATKLEQPGAPVTAAGAPAGEERVRHRRRRRGRVRQSVQPRGSARSMKDEYPKFRREGDTLVKIGWSKSTRAEYEHRAPKRVAEALSRAIEGLKGKGPLFTVDELLPLADPSDGTEVPGYQVYLALAWLRKEGIVRQNGRDGYSVMVTEGLEKVAEERWTTLSCAPSAKREIT